MAMGNKETELQARWSELIKLDLYGAGLTPEQRVEEANIEKELREIYKVELEEHIAQKKETSQRVKHAQQRGRNAEYQCVKYTHGVRVGRSKAVKVGDKYIQVNCQQSPDVLSAPFFSFECKNKKFPKSVVNAVSQSIRNAPEGFSPYVWWYNPEDGITYIVCTRHTFLEMHF